mgnify:FL=1|tara:strand:+ start:572 stop:793 length:222 start_codon:yes stop_codon:yes gene_type:complete
MAHSIDINGTVPLTGDMVKDAHTTIAIADAVEAFKAAITTNGGTLTMVRGYAGPADAKKERKPRVKKAAPDAA